jgi:hypothetical protein
MTNNQITLQTKVAASVVGMAFLGAIIAGIQVYAQQDPDQLLYNDDLAFEQLSSGGQMRLIAKFGQPLAGAAASLIAPSADYSLSANFAPLVLPPPIPTNVLVNSLAEDLTAQDTQSETTLVLGSGSNVVVGFNDSGSLQGPTFNQFTGYSLSTNGGLTFTDKGRLPASANGDVGDPVLARDTVSGTIYFSTLMFSGSGMQCFRSFDNGATFTAPVNCAPGTLGFQDKDWMTVDNFTGSGQGNVYVAWRDFGPAAQAGIRFSSSTNGGSSYGPSGGTLIAAPMGFNVQGAFPAVGPDHAVYVFWLDQSAGFSTPNIIKMRKSTNQGVTFGAAVTIKTLNTNGVNGDLALNGGFRTNAFVQAAVNPASASQIYAVYNDCSSTPCTSATDHGDVFLISSTNGGTTWGAPVKVNDDSTTHDQFMPAIAITPNGQNMFVSWYDRRNDPSNSLIERWGALGSIAAGGAVTFQPNQLLSSSNFPVVRAQDPVVNTTYMGDYDQVVANDNSGFCITWGDNRLANPNFPAHTHQPDVRFVQVPVCAPPVISNVSATPNSLWPPNHKYVDVTINYTDTSTCSSTCVLSVTSNETPSNPPVVVDANHVKLVAERDGNGSGRIYTITITCTNASGSSSKTVAVLVPHDQGS